MKKSDFHIRAIPMGYFLYYKGKFIGCGGGSLSHDSGGVGIRKSLKLADEEINKIIDGHGDIGFIAVINSIDKTAA